MCCTHRGRCICEQTRGGLSASAGRCGASYRMPAYETNIEGEWDNVFTAVKRCHEVVHKMGAPRISTTIKVGTRIDREQTMADKIESFTDKRTE